MFYEFRFKPSNASHDVILDMPAKVQITSGHDGWEIAALYLNSASLDPGSFLFSAVADHFGEHHANEVDAIWPVNSGT